MGKKLVSLMVFIISILTFELVSSWLSGHIVHLRALTNPYKATLIGMGVVAFVLFPAYKWLDRSVQQFSKKLLTAGKGRSAGILLTFLSCIFVLYLCYMQLWFSIPFARSLKEMFAALAGHF